MSDREPLISLQDIEKIYPGGFHALRGVSLDVAKGEVVSIIGPSGCGKSTLLRTINGLEDIQGGKILLEGRVIAEGGVAPSRKSKAGWRNVRTEVGMVFQNYELFPHLSVLDNLLIAPKVVRGVNPADAKVRALELLERVGLKHKAQSKPRELSGGQKQRVAIVRALMMQPKALLLDEITASLDPEIVREVLEVVMGLADDGMTMLVVTHEMSFARAVSNRIVFMDAGQIVEVGSPASFFEKPATERAQRFLATLVF